MRIGTRLILLLIILLPACKKENPEEKARAFFKAFKSNFMDDYWRHFPESATLNGYHAYDSELRIPDDSARRETRDFAGAILEKLNAVDAGLLDPRDRSDYFLIRNEMQSQLWYSDTLKPWAWQPSYYNPGALVGYMLRGRYEPLEARLRHILERLEKLPAYYDAAQASIRKPSKPHTEMARVITDGMIELLEKDIPDSLRQAGLYGSKDRETLDRALHAARSFRGFLDRLMEKGAFRDFRPGEALYERKFELDLQSDYTPESLREAALYEKEEAHTQILRLTQKLWPKYFAEERSTFSLAESARLIDRISEKHTTPDSFLQAIRRQLPELIRFIREKDLLFIDPEKPLKVRVAPKYLRGIAIASISAPGPYDKYENTWYNVSPVWEMDEEAAESYLREYNDYMMQILNIHEAIPGHYVQLVYANESPDIIKSIFGSGSMIEGWACYAERMMLEEGWGENSPELRLMYYKWYLRIIGNSLIDIGVHSRGWERDSVLRFLTEEAFQERSEAEGKWRRVQRSSVQLCSYFAGLIEILDLRDEIKSRKGDGFDLKNFHERFLSYGSIPVKYIRRLMLTETDEAPARDHSEVPDERR